jgi:hypothetical protein
MVSSPDHPGEYLLATQRDRLPLTYTRQAVKDHGTDLDRKSYGGAVS